jgi:hypothetical protein
MNVQTIDDGVAIGRDFNSWSRGLAMRRRSFLRLMAGVAVTATAPSLIKPRQAFAGTLSRYHDSMILTLKGVDGLSNALYASNEQVLYESRDLAQSWFRSSVPWPPGLDKRTAYFQRWKGVLYCSGTYLDASSTKHMGLWRRVDGTWTRVLAGVAGSSANTRCVLDGDDKYLHIGEYGRPSGGPHIYRSRDGVSWEASFTKLGWKHIHALACDPFRPGHVYATVGDGIGVTLIRSTNYGSPGSYAIAIKPGTYQSVQISFASNEVWLASDNAWTSDPDTAFTVNRDTLMIRDATPNYHQELAVPGQPGAKWRSNAYFGAVDPQTGHYYCVTGPGSNSGTAQGMFIVEREGAPVQLFAGPKSIGCLARVHIFRGYVLTDNWFAPLVP